jgi:hypothetical protein
VSSTLNAAVKPSQFGGLNRDNQVKTLVPGQHHLTRIVNIQECSTFIELDNNRDEVSGTKSSQSERFKSGLQGSIG